MPDNIDLPKEKHIISLNETTVHIKSYCHTIPGLVTTEQSSLQQNLVFFQSYRLNTDGFERDLISLMLSSSFKKTMHVPNVFMTTTTGGAI